MSDNNGDDFTPKLFELDKNRLDDEWMRQSQLVYAAGVAAADARESWERSKVARDVAKSDLEKTEAQLDQRIRRDPASFGLVKITEDAVAHLIILQDEHELAKGKLWEAEGKVIKKRHALDLCETECKALDPNRLKQLENLTVLDNRSYWDRVKVERGPRDEGTSERVRRELNRKTQCRTSNR